MKTNSKATKQKKVWLGAKIISRSPLITISTGEFDKIMLCELRARIPEVFDVKQGLHFVSITANLELGGEIRLVKALKKAQELFPGHQFIILASNETEVYMLSKLGIANILANASIFIDEKVWRILRSKKPVFDAIYVARMVKLKRHELAAKIEKPVFVYGSLGGGSDIVLEHVKKIAPQAYYANHEIGQGEYQYLSAQTVCELSGQSKVGLCLSPHEGHMRASMQYLLGGLPVVSTPSIGGRDRYYSGEYCKVVDDSADAVKTAVEDFIDQQIDPRIIRQRTGEMLGFDRYNFIITVNRIATVYFAKDKVNLTFHPFRGSIADIKSIDVIIQECQSITG